MAKWHQNTFQVAPINKIILESCPQTHPAESWLQFIIILILFQFKIVSTLKLTKLTVKQFSLGGMPSNSLANAWL